MSVDNKVPSLDDLIDSQRRLVKKLQRVLLDAASMPETESRSLTVAIDKLATLENLRMARSQ